MFIFSVIFNDSVYNYWKSRLLPKKIDPTASSTGTVGTMLSDCGTNHPVVSPVKTSANVLQAVANLSVSADVQLKIFAENTQASQGSIKEEVSIREAGNAEITEINNHLTFEEKSSTPEVCDEEIIDINEAVVKSVETDDESYEDGGEESSDEEGKPHLSLGFVVRLKLRVRKTQVKVSGSARPPSSPKVRRKKRKFREGISEAMKKKLEYFEEALDIVSLNLVN